LLLYHAYLHRLLALQVKGSDIPPPLKYWSDLEKPQKQRHKPEQQQQQQLQKAHNKKGSRAAAAAAAETDSLLIPQKLMAHLAESGWHTPTPIQRQAVPALLNQRELLAVAPTGKRMAAMSYPPPHIAISLVLSWLAVAPTSKDGNNDVHPPPLAPPPCRVALLADAPRTPALPQQCMRDRKDFLSLAGDRVSPFGRCDVALYKHLGY
jgi:hypothetical protein